MDPTITHQPQNAALDAAIASYLQAVERGDQPDRQQFLAQHPQLAAELTRFFHDQDEINRLTQPASTRLGPGSLLGSYRIKREIGRGGMGIVYEAIHEALKKRVALKLLPLSPTSSGSHLERFLREAQTAAALHHTNIVPVFDVGQVDGLPFYAMQFIEGATLDKLFPSRQVEGTDVWSPSPQHKDSDGLSPSPPRGEGLGVRGSESSVLAPDSKRVQHKNKPLTPGPSPREGEGRKNHYKHIAQLGRQAALGLAYAHERGVIHRDIKPSNLILDDQGVLWITDFGLAKRLDDVTLTAAGQLLGTPRYMSPEQASAAKHPVDHRTDIYSLGVTLYELLAGRPAHDGQTPPEVVNQILTRDPISPRRLDPQLPRDLETVVMKAMAKVPNDRYASASELAADLDRFTQGEPVQARRVGVLGRTWRWAKREPRVARLVGAVVGSLVLGLVGTGWFLTQSFEARDKVMEKSLEYARTIGKTAAYCGSELAKGSEDFKYLAWFTIPLALDIANEEKQVYRRRIAMFLRYHTRGGANENTELPSDISLIPGKLGVYNDPIEIDPFTPKAFEPIFFLANNEVFPQLYDRANNIAFSIGTESIAATEVTDLREIERHRFMLTGSGQPVSPHLKSGYSSWPGVDTSNVISTNSYIRNDFIYHIVDKRVIAIYNFRPFEVDDGVQIELANLLACHRLDRGRYVPLTLAEARTGWTTLKAKYPDVFTVPIDDCLAWHLKEDAESVRKKHQHAALFAANFDCRDRPTEPHPFVARGRLFTVLGDYDKAAADFAMAWKLGGTGWVKSECRRMVRDAWRSLQATPSPVIAAPSPLTPLPRGGEGNQTTERAGSQTADLRTAYRKLQIAATYLEQDPRTLSIALLGKPPLHRLALAIAKQRLGIEWDERDRAAMASLLR